MGAAWGVSSQHAKPLGRARVGRDVKYQESFAEIR